MDIKSVGTLHKDGRLFEKLNVSGVGEGLTVSAYVPEDENARIAPCDLRRVGTDEYIAVVPDCAGDGVRVALGAFSAEGELVESDAHQVSAPHGSKLRKMFGHGDGASDEDLLACAAEPEPQNASGFIKVRDVAPTPTHIVAHLDVYVEDTTSADLRVRVLGNEFECEARDFTLMGEKPLELSEFSSDRGTCSKVSVPIPWNLGDLFILAWDVRRPDHFVMRRLPKKEWEPLFKEYDKLIYTDASRDPDYPKWFAEHKLDACTARRERTVSFPVAPKFSLIVPLYKTPLGFLNELVDSVSSQTYGNWECVLANSTPEDEALCERIDQIAKADPRFRVVTLEKNLGISLNTNAGIAQSKGDFVCFLDHDDLLEPDILFEYARAVNERPDTDVIYCDEDKLGEDRVLFEPTFKPDFSLDLLRSNNYICHMLTIRRSLLDQLEPNRQEFDGAQDYNLLLEAVEKARHVAHVARVLYHWRVCETSTAGGNNAKPYASKAGLKGLQAHLDRMGLNAEATEVEGLMYRYKIRYAVPEPAPLVSIVVPSCGHAAELKRCVDSVIAKSTYENFEVVVVDMAANGEEGLDGTSCDARVRVERWGGAEGDYSGAVNFGCGQAKGDYLLLLSDGAEVVTPDWIEQLVGNCAREEVGAVGCRLLTVDGFVQSAGMFISGEPASFFERCNKGDIGYLFFLISQRNASAVSGCCLMVKRSDFDAVGGFSPEFSAKYGDLDFCLRLGEAGKLNVTLPYADVQNCDLRPVPAAGSDRERAETVRFKTRWSELYSKGDPFYNKNLSADPVLAAHWRL